MNRTLCRWAVAALCATAALVAAPAFRHADEARAAAPAVDEAQGLYNEAKFTDAIAKLRDALASGQLKGRDELKAKELLGRCLVKGGDRIEAKEAFKSLLRQSGGWQLDPQSTPPDEMEVFSMARREIRAEQVEAGR